MANKTALQTLIAWGDEMMKQEPMKLLSFAEAIDKAVELLEMEKEQIIDAAERWKGTNFAEQYYNETYKEDKQ
jgi:hypothetical protein